MNTSLTEVLTVKGESLLKAQLEQAEVRAYEAEKLIAPLQQRLMAETARANNHGVAPLPPDFSDWSADYYQLITFNFDLCNVHQSRGDDDS